MKFFDVLGEFKIFFLKQKPAGKKFDAFVATALVVDGGVHPHYLIVQDVESRLLEAGFQTGVPVMSVSLTFHHLQPNIGHKTLYVENVIKKGSEAVQAPVAACDLHAHLQLPPARAVA